MQIDLDHLHHWMCAIRESKDPIRTLDAFWRGQMTSKEWLIDCLDEHVHMGSSVDIHGGWVGVLASMLFQSNIPVTKIRSIDIDPMCEETARTMNKIEEINGRFTAVTANMCDIESTADIIINTSCEHITQYEYDKWLKALPKTSLLVLQGNNFDIPEHVRISKDLEEFEKQCGVNVVWSGEIKLPLYKRFMVIGKK